MTALPELPPTRPQPPIEPTPDHRDLYTLLASPAGEPGVPVDDGEPAPTSPLDSLALALAELVDARATIRRLLHRLDDERSTAPGPATLQHHLGRADRLINAAAYRLASHRCVADVDALSGSVTAAIERGFTDLRQALQSAGGVATVGAPTDSGDVPNVARPQVVCLCGSTRFKAEFEAVAADLTRAGRIVLTVNEFGNDGHPEKAHLRTVNPDEKAALDELHKRKIDLADEVLVLNVGGYIGVSTRSEIDYAQAHRKPVSYLEARVPPAPWSGAVEVQP